MNSSARNPYKKDVPQMPPPPVMPKNRYAEKKQKQQQHSNHPVFPIVTHSPMYGTSNINTGSSYPLQTPTFPKTNTSETVTTGVSHKKEILNSVLQNPTLKRPPSIPLRADIVNKHHNKKQRFITHTTLVGPVLLADNLINSNLDDSVTKSKRNDNGSNIADSNKQRSASITISIFKVYLSCLYCSECNKPVGIGIETVRRHMKNYHPTLWRSIAKFSPFHAKILSVKSKLNENKLPVVVEPGAEVLRFKCHHCHRSYRTIQNFQKHVRQSNGLCRGSSPISTLYATLGCGWIVESVALGLSVSPSINPRSRISFPTVKETISEFIPKDEDVDTFISLFTPLVSTNLSFESIIIGYINRYKQPPADHEGVLYALLQMGEKWLME